VSPEQSRRPAASLAEDRSAQTLGQDAQATWNNASSYDWNQHSQGIRLAIDLVKFEDADRGVAEHLLGKTVIVDTLADAVALQQSGPAGFRFVTKGGEVGEAEGTLGAGPLTGRWGCSRGD